MPSSRYDLANWLGRTKSHHRPDSHRRAIRPRLEGLEDRAVPSTLVVATVLDNGAGSLREAVARARDGDTIVFDSRLRGQTIVLTSGQLVIRDSVDIEGPGASRLTVSGGDSSRVFKIQPGLSVRIAGLTIAQGRAVGGKGGGGILNLGSSLTIADDVLSHNEADDAIAEGGAVSSQDGAVLTAVRCTFIANRAVGDPEGGLGFGGALFNGSFTNATPTTAAVRECTFVGNRAVGGDGGTVQGLFNLGSASGGGIENESGGDLTVVDSTFIGNQAVAGSGGSGGKFKKLCVVDVALGGGINSADGTTLAVSACLFSDNVAAGGSGASGSTSGPGRVGNGVGGGLANLGIATVEGSTFCHNRALGGSGNRGGSDFTLVGRGSGGGISSNAFGDSPASLALSNSTFNDNQAVGGGGNAAGTLAGDGVGGGFANFFGSTATVSDCTFTGNQANGGVGGTGGNGGNGFGGGVYNDGQSSLTATGTTITGNQATGGAAGPGGSAGVGEGGGLYLAEGGSACLDVFTQSHTKRNRATNDHDDIFGSFTTC